MNYTGCRPFSDVELERVLHAFGGRYAARDRLMVTMGAHTGFRVGELLSLRVRDVWDGYQSKREVTVARGYMKGRRRARTMPLHQNVREAIEDWIKVYGIGMADLRDRPLFPRQRTLCALTRRQVALKIIAAAKTAGIDTARVSTHSLRKSFARKMWEHPQVRGDMARMARLLGHSNYANTLRYLEFASELEDAVLSV